MPTATQVIDHQRQVIETQEEQLAELEKALESAQSPHAITMRGKIAVEFGCAMASGPGWDDCGEKDIAKAGVQFADEILELTKPKKGGG